MQFRVGDRVRVVSTFDHNPNDGESPIGKVGMVMDVDKDIGWAWVEIASTDEFSMHTDEFSMHAELWRFDYADIALVGEGG